MKKTALFDLDGTLFNTSLVNYNAYNKTLNELGISVDRDYFINECNGKYYKDFLKDIVKTDEEMEYVHKRKKELYKNYLNEAKVNEHLFNIISLIKKEYNIGLVTTASKDNTYDILNYFQKTHLFDIILTNEDIVKVKPNPEGYLKAMDYFNASKEDTVIFEDSEVGIEAAILSGAKVFVVKEF